MNKNKRKKNLSAKKFIPELKSDPAMGIKEARIECDGQTEWTDPLEQENRFQIEVKRLVFCTVGALIMAFNLKSFVDAGGLFPGGIAGLTLLILRSLKSFAGIALPYTAVYIPLNAIPIYLAVRYLGKRFTFYSVYVIILSSILTDMMPHIPITYDVLLISVFGGIVNGIACVVCLHVGASVGGSDFISLYLSERKGIDAWNIILIANVIVLVIAGALFGWDKSLYSIIYQFCSTQVKQSMYKRYQQHTLLVITDMPEAVYDKISILTHHDASLFRGEGFYGDKPINMIYSVVSSDDVQMITSVIKQTDPNAFVNVMKTEQITGRFYRKPNE